MHTISANAKEEARTRGMKSLAGSNEFWGTDRKCWDSHRSAKLEAESSKVLGDATEKLRVSCLTLSV